MFTLAQRYLISSFIPPFLGATAFFLAFLLAFQLFRVIGFVIQKGMDRALLFQLLGDISLSFLALALPLAVFVAAFYGLRRRSESLEVIALHSLGLSRRQLLTPFFFLALLIAGVLFLLQMDVIPQAKSRFKNTVIQLSNRGLLSDIEGGKFFTEIPDFILFADKVDKKSKNMEHVFINSVHGGLEQFIFAEKGSLVKEFHGKLHPPSLRLYLTNGNMLKLSRKESNMEKIIFKEYDFPLKGRTKLFDAVTKDSMKTHRHLLRDIAKRKKLVRERPHSKKWRRRLNNSLLEYWLRIQTPFQCLVFMFWGVLFGLRSHHNERRSKGGLWAFSLLTGYHALFVFSIVLAKEALVTPLGAVLLPNTLAVLAVVGLLWRRRQTQSA